MTDHDEAAFTACFDAHRHAVYAFALARLSDPDAARDVLQETFLRLWRRFTELRHLDDGRLRAWLVTVARNLVVDRYRTVASGRAALTALQQTHDDTDHDTAERIAQRDQLARLETAIAELPDDEREVLTMTTIGGLTSAEVGAALGIPAGTARSTLHRARGKLARVLEDDR